jgi:hypothetical protein
MGALSPRHARLPTALPVPPRTPAGKAGFSMWEGEIPGDTDCLLEGDCVDALRGSRAFLAWDRHAGCGFVSGLFARPMAAGLDGLSASRGSHLDFAL